MRRYLSAFCLGVGFAVHSPLGAGFIAIGVLSLFNVLEEMIVRNATEKNSKAS